MAGTDINVDVAISISEGAFENEIGLCLKEVGADANDKPNVNIENRRTDDMCPNDQDVISEEMKSA